MTRTVPLSWSRSSSSMISPWKLGWLNPKTMSCTGPIAMMAPLPDPQASPVGVPWNLTNRPALPSHHSTLFRGALHRPDGMKDAGHRRARPCHLWPNGADSIAPLTYALPHLAVQARLELARCHLALADAAAARILLREI